MRNYNSFAEIDVELKKLSLKRKISWEEMKYSTNKIQEDLVPYNWMLPVFKTAKKFGVYFLLKKFFKN